MDIITQHPAVATWLILTLGGAVVGLVLYVWNDKKGRDKEDRDGFKSALNEVKVSLSSIAAEFKSAMDALGRQVGKRMDDIEEEQVSQGKAIVNNDQRISGVIAVCKERARHCQMFAAGEGTAHFHRRMGEAGERCHQRCGDDDAQDGSDS